MHSRILTFVAALLTVMVVAACGQAAKAPTAQEPTTLAVPTSATGSTEPILTETSPLTAAIVSTAPVALGIMAGMTETMPDMVGMGHGAMAKPGQPFDVQFIDSMIGHHQSAITMATMVLEQGEHPELRAMAEEIISAQEAEIVQMQAWRTAWYPDLPASEAMAMGEMMLSNDTSMPFDRRFLEAMISHHRGVIMMAEAAVTQVEHEEIRQQADAIISDQEAEISQMHEWINAWYPGQAQDGPSTSGLTGSIWVANEAGNSLSVIDAATNRIVTTLTGIEGPHNVQVAADGRTVWAVSGHDSLAVAVDTQNYTLLGAIPVGNSPAHVIVSPDGATVWVSNSGDNTVSIIDTATYTIVQTIPVGAFPHGLRPSADGGSVAVANMQGDSVSLIDTTTFEVENIEAGVAPVQVAFAPDGGALYVTLNGADAVAKVDMDSRTVVGTAAVGDGPVQVYVTPDSRLALVANQGTADSPSTTLSIVDAASMREVAQVETGLGAHGVAVEPGGRYAYVTNLYGSTLVVVDLAERTVVTTVPTGSSPNGVSFSTLAPAAAAPEIALPVPDHGGEAAGTEGHEVHQ